MTQINNGDRIVLISTHGLSYNNFFRTQYGEISQLFEDFEECDVYLIPQHDTIRVSFKQIRHCTEEEDREVSKLIQNNQLSFMDHQEEPFDNVYAFYHEESASTLIGSMIEINGELRKFKVHGGGYVEIESRYLMYNMKRIRDPTFITMNQYDHSEARLFSEIQILKEDPNPHECEIDDSFCNGSFSEGIHSHISGNSFNTPSGKQEDQFQSPIESPIPKHDGNTPYTTNVQKLQRPKDDLSFDMSITESSSEYEQSHTSSANTSSTSSIPILKKKGTNKENPIKKFSTQNIQSSKSVQQIQKNEKNESNGDDQKDKQLENVNFWLDEALAIHKHTYGLYICSPYKSKAYKGTYQVRVRYHNCPPTQDEWAPIDKLQPYNSKIKTVNQFDESTVYKYKSRRLEKVTKGTKTSNETHIEQKQKDETKSSKAAHIQKTKSEEQKKILQERNDKSVYSKNNTTNKNQQSKSAKSTTHKPSTNTNLAQSETNQTQIRKRKRLEIVQEDNVPSIYESPAIILRKLARNALGNGQRKRRRVEPLRL